jgi:hypothetical protein
MPIEYDHKFILVSLARSPSGLFKNAEFDSNDLLTEKIPASK